MIKGSDITVNVIASVIASLILLSVGFIGENTKNAAVLDASSRNTIFTLT